MGQKRRDAPPTFAEVVAQLSEDSGSGQAVPVVNVAHLDEFTDADGVRWHRRGGLLEGKALHRLLGNPNVRALHDYMGETTAVPPPDREHFWATAQEQMEAFPHANFYGAEFKTSGVSTCWSSMKTADGSAASMRRKCRSLRPTANERWATVSSWRATRTSQYKVSVPHSLSA